MRKPIYPCIIMAVFLMLRFALASDSDDQCDYVPAPDPPTFTYEGELNPDDFDNWQILGVQPTPIGLKWVYIANPDKTSPIEIVAMSIDNEQTLFGYQYFKHGDPWRYVFDSKQTKYVGGKLPKHEALHCLSCHQDKVITQKAI